MDDSVVTVKLRKVRDFLKVQKHWTQGKWGIDEHGHSVQPHDPAVARCLLGTVRWVNGDDEFYMCEYLKRAINHVDSNAYGVSITNWNDDPERQHKDIVEVTRLAVKFSRQDNKPA